MGLLVLVGGYKGVAGGLVAAALAALSIIGGKIGSVAVAMGGVEEEIAKEITMVDYEEARRDWTDFPAADSTGRYAEFMVSHGFTEAGSPGEVDPQEVEWFKSEAAPELRAEAARNPSFETWRGERAAETATFVRANASWGSMFMETLGLMDIIFFALGVGTAFKIPAREN